MNLLFITSVVHLPPLAYSVHQTGIKGHRSGSYKRRVEKCTTSIASKAVGELPVVLQRLFFTCFQVLVVSFAVTNVCINLRLILQLFA